MKKLAAYYLVLFYLASLCKPASIWFADEMAHTYFSHQHATVVHHERGKDHVHYQIGKAAKDDAPEQKNATPKTEDQIPSTSFIDKITRTDRLLASLRRPQFATRLSSVFLSQPPPPPWLTLPDYFG